MANDNHSTEALLATTSGGEKAARLCELLSTGKTIAVPGAFNAMAAKLIEQAGFPAVYVSGAGLNNGAAGYPDIGMLTQTEMAQLSGYIARATHLPTIADVDTGFGEAMNVYRTVQLYEDAGLAGIHVEDQVFPKRCGHLAGKSVISPEAMTQKVRAACQARRDANFLIIARVDSKAMNGFDDALNRARLYLDAGAEMIFPEALTTEEEFAQFATELRKTHPHAWLLANMTEFGKTPLIPVSRFQELGYNLVIFPMTMFRRMMHALTESLAELAETGTQAGFMDRLTPRSELYDVLNYPAYSAMDERLSAQAPAVIHS